MFADCWHPVVNGVVTSIDILRSRLVGLGHEVELYVPNAPGSNLPVLPGIHRFASFTVPIHKESCFSVPFPIRHVAHALRTRPDVVHLHTPFNLGILGVLTAWRWGVPYVFTHHTLWEEYVHYVPLVSPRTSRRAAIALCRAYGNHAGAVIAPSAEVQERFKQQGVTSPIDVIPTGIDVEIFENGQPERVRAELDLSEDEPVAIYAGRMGKEKSLDFVLGAFRLVLKELPRARLLMIGGGPEKEALEAIAARLGIERRVVFTGYVPRTRLVDYFRAAHVFVFASTTETQGLVSLEAQAAGLPVVAVRASGSTEAVVDGETGFLVARDEEAFSAATVRMLRDVTLRDRMAAKASAHAHACSSQSMAERALAVYESAIERCRRGVVRSTT